MKEEFHNETIDAEQLLRTKSWNQLNDEEQTAVGELFSGEAEYERVRGLMDQLRTGSGIEEEEIQPSEKIRENLLSAFENEQRRRRVLWWNSLGFWFRDQLRLDIPAVRFAIAGVVLILGFVAVMQLTVTENPPAPIAKKDNVQPAPSPVQHDDATDQYVNSDKEKTVIPEEVNNSPNISPDVIIPPVPSQGPPQVVDGGYNNNPLNRSGTSNEIVQDANGNTPVIADTSAQLLATNSGVDSIVSPVVTFTNATSICTGTSGTITASGGTPAYTYTWNATSNNGTPVSLSPTNANVTGICNVVYVPNCRSLANDEKVIDAMFTMR